MKKLFYASMILLVLLFTGGCSKENEPVVTPADQTNIKLQDAVDRLYNDYMKKYPDYPGSLVLKVTSPNGSYFAVAGDKNITSDAHFRCASNTKSFTAAAVLLLVQEGKIKIDDTITGLIPGTNETYIPMVPGYWIPNYNHITIRQLLQHRAGVFDVTNSPIPEWVGVPYHGQMYIEYVQSTDPTHTFTFDELVGVVAQCGLSYALPGEIYHYSNTGYSILGKIIERVSGMSYHDFITEKIINPMGLTNTSCPVSGTETSLPVPFTSGFIYTQDTLADVTVSNISGNVAEGNIITTADDLAKYLRTLLRGEGPLSSYTVNNLMLNPISTSQVNWYACGLFYQQNLGFGHNGAHEGYLSRMVYDPSSDFTAVAYTNCWNLSEDMQSMVFQLNNMLDEVCYEAKKITIKK